MLDIYHLCSKCNKEYKLDFGGYETMSFFMCPYCKHTDGLWLRVCLE